MRCLVPEEAAKKSNFPPLSLLHLVLLNTSSGIMTALEVTTGHMQKCSPGWIGLYPIWVLQSFGIPASFHPSIYTQWLHPDLLTSRVMSVLLSCFLTARRWERGVPGSLKSLAVTSPGSAAAPSSAHDNSWALWLTPDCCAAGVARDCIQGEP